LPSFSIDPSTFIIYIDGSAVNDGIMGHYDSFSQSTSIASFEYEIKYSLSVGSHTLRVTVSDTAGDIYDDHRDNLQVMNSPAVIGRTILYPNPYNSAAGSLKITYNLAVDTNITIYMFDINGRFVWKNTYISGFNGGKAGYNEVLWNGNDAFGNIAKNELYLIRVIDTSTGNMLGKSKLMILRTSSSINKNDADIKVALKNNMSIALITLLFVGLALYGGSIKVYNAIKKFRRK